MVDSPLLIKSKAFALEIIRVCNKIKHSKKESILTNQLVRSGTSIGANIIVSFCRERYDQISQISYNWL